MLNKSARIVNTVHNTYQQLVTNSTVVINPENLVVTDFTFYILPTLCIYVFCMDIRTNSDFFPYTALTDWLL
jgi:hypothetical protein